jgi:hypothetical protein
MDGNIFNSEGRHVGIVRGSAILSIDGQRLFVLRGEKIYLPSGELVGHLPNANLVYKRLGRIGDKLFINR